MQENYDEFQVGNWVLYLPQDNYCTIKSLEPELILKWALRECPSIFNHIGKVKITQYKLQVCEFDVQDNIFTKNFNNEICVALFLSSPGVYKLYKNEQEVCEVQFIHQVQNAYYEITGELLQGNLYGVRER